jgi:hypothetical protein
VPEHCSAFVAVGSSTRDGKVVIAHNNWTEYKDGSRWNIIFDIAPSEGYRILMEGMPGLVHSGDDFGVNSAGLAITETTIGHFTGFDPKGIPEFERAHDGYFVGSNFPANPELIRDEASDYPVADLSISGDARRVRWEQLMQENKGKIDVAAAQAFLAITTIRSRMRLHRASERCAGTSIFPRAGPCHGSPPSGLRARCRTRPPTLRC